MSSSTRFRHGDDRGGTERVNDSRGAASIGVFPYLLPAHTQSWQENCTWGGTVFGLFASLSSFIEILPRKDSATGMKEPCEDE